MLVDQSGNPLLLAGHRLSNVGRFVDTFNRSVDDSVTPLGNGWTDLAQLFPANYDPSGIYQNGVVCRDPRRRSRYGSPQANNTTLLWEDYQDWDPPGWTFGGVGGAIRDTGSTSYNVACVVNGVVEGHNDGNPNIEAEGTPIVGVNIAEPGLGWGVWFSNLAQFGEPDFPVFLCGYVGNPPENFDVDYIGTSSVPVGTPRLIEIRYRGTTVTVWEDGVQVTTISTVPGGTPMGTDPIPITRPAHQNQTWAGFEFDMHNTIPEADIPIHSPIDEYWHQVV